MKSLLSLMTILLAVNSAFAANCEKNPSHPSCQVEPPTSSTVTIDSVIIDKVNSQVEVAGSGLNGIPISISGDLIPTDAGSSDSLVILPFGPALASVVLESGNYTLQAGDTSMSVYFDGQVFDTSSDLCPCGDFTTQLAGEGLAEIAPNCIIVSSSEINSDFLSQQYPAALGTNSVYIVGSAFTPATPSSSVCQMVKIDAVASQSTLISAPVSSSAQHNACAAVMLSNPLICGQAAE